MKGKKSKLIVAREEAFGGKVSLEKLEARDFGKDPLKHYVRLNYWLPRAKKLVRARGIKKMRYLSLPAATAIDYRLFKREGLIDHLQANPIPFVYCESDKRSFQILQDTLKSFSAIGFDGKLEDIATDSTNAHYGRFWGTFPIDIVNLDFWGDIHKAKDPEKNVFYTIKTIISHQAPLRDPYDLWITWRAKPDRIASNVENAYQELIQENTKEQKEFGKSYRQQFSSRTPSDLEVDDLVRIGFIKWILYVTKTEFSVVDKGNTQVLVYTRKDGDGNPYRLYNFLIRIKPYENIVIPSPVGEAARFCAQKYSSNINLCFEKPVDIDREYRDLSKRRKKQIQDDLIGLLGEYEIAKSSSLK